MRIILTLLDELGRTLNNPDKTIFGTKVDWDKCKYLTVKLIDRARLISNTSNYDLDNDYSTETFKFYEVTKRKCDQMIKEANKNILDTYTYVEKDIKKQLDDIRLIKSEYAKKLKNK